MASPVSVTDFGAVERMMAEAATGQKGSGAMKLLDSLQQPADVARVIAALCLDDASAITGQVFLVARDRIGLFRPLEADQQATAEAPTCERAHPMRFLLGAAPPADAGRRRRCRPLPPG